MIVTLQTACTLCVLAVSVSVLRIAASSMCLPVGGSTWIGLLGSCVASSMLAAIVQDTDTCLDEFT